QLIWPRRERGARDRYLTLSTTIESTRKRTGQLQRLCGLQVEHELERSGLKRPRRLRNGRRGRKRRRREQVLKSCHPTIPPGHTGGRGGFSRHFGPRPRI